MKKIIKLLKHILKGVNTHRKRVILTILGIILSVTSYFVGTILVNAVYGLQLDTYKNFNPHSILVADTLNVNKLDELKIKYRNSKIQGFTYSSPKYISRSDKTKDVADFTVRFIGVEPEFTAYPVPSIYTTNCLEQTRVVLGRNFTDEDFIFQRKVVILPLAFSKAIFGDTNPLGKSFLVETMGEYQVVGLLKDTDDVNKAVKRMNRRVFDPKITNNTLEIQAFIPNVSIGPVTQVNRTVFTFEEIDILSAYNVLVADIYNKNPGNIFILSKIVDDINEEIEEVNRTILSLMLLLLLLSGISLSTILSFSFKERISEIGLKKALGAKNGDILDQFFWESIINGLIGGVIGLILGILLVLVAGPLFLELNYKSILNAITFNQLLIPMLLSMLISVLFSLIPAIFAVNKDIIDALRSE